MKIKNSAACAFLLASSPVLANTKLGSGQPPPSSDKTDTPPAKTKEVRPPIPPSKTNQKFNIASINLDKANKSTVKVCDNAKLRKQKRPRARNVVSLAFNPNKKQVATLQFDMEDILTSKDEQVLLVLYSRCLSKKPKIKTPLSRKKLALDVNDLEILGTYNIAAQSDSTQMTVEVDLETDKLAKQAKAGNDTFYFQAALLKKSDFDKKHYGATKLSPLEAVHVTQKSCPEQKAFSDNVRSENTSCKGLPNKSN
ncbi:hypothetical protein QUF74_16460 [Candidatus Halobeggiatoa sp. HSG11]|nr:hypothetical protein [Candidatus Halobeggiatoa sp. HSG11]